MCVSYSAQELEAVVEQLARRMVVDGVHFVVGHAILAHENQVVLYLYIYIFAVVTNEYN